MDGKFLQSESVLPPLYARWIDELLQRQIPEESKATCSECAMCRTQDSPPPQEVRFNDATKCCTYHPDIPNFLAGAILIDRDLSAAEGKRRLRERMKAAALVRPQGIYPSLEENARYSALSQNFGADVSMLCPYYIAESGGQCGIWKHRNARCATWFCKHNRGAVGRDFWRTLKELIAAIEQYLSLWCIQRLEVGTPEFRDLFSLNISPDLQTFQRRQEFLYRSALPAEHLTSQEAERIKRQMWGSWLYREEIFYMQCATVVDGFDWRKIMELENPVIQSHSVALQEAFAQLTTSDLPEFLKPGVFQSLPLGENGVRVWAYSQYDPVDLPEWALRVLPYFDGRPTEEVLAWVQTHSDLPVTRDLVFLMHDYGILKAVYQ